MLNSPSNPTGTVYTRQELEALADVVIEANLSVLSDEIYERLVYGDARATCFATLRPELAESTITVSGVSKTYAMTGWRIGWAAGPLHIIKAMGNVQSQQTSNPCSISQYAALAALEGNQECVEKMRQEFETRRDLVCQPRGQAARGEVRHTGRRVLPLLRCFGSLWPYLGGKKVTDSTTFCMAALESAHVSLVQGPRSVPRAMFAFPSRPAASSSRAALISWNASCGKANGRK